MLINETTINCCKPKRFIAFKGTEQSENPKRKVRYKHYEEMSDEVLSLRSVLKAHKEVENSGKMRLFKAMPRITTVLLGTTIALTQPGKLSAKAAAGLGFLALTDTLCLATDKAAQVLDERQKRNQEQSQQQKTGKFDTVKKVAKTALAIGIGVAACVGVKNSKAFKNASKFIAKEGKQLADEINNSRIAKYCEEKITPFVQKHSKGVEIAKGIAPIGVIVGSTLAQMGLADSLSEDIKEKATKNYIKGKQIQQVAREHFNSIDAQEV